MALTEAALRSGVDESWATMDRVPAQVIGYDPANYRWAVFIDKGRDDGIRADMAVVNSDGLVGGASE